MTRREFFRVALRGLLLGGIGWLAVVLGRRSCAGRGPCGTCAAYGRCELPWKEARR